MVEKMRLRTTVNGEKFDRELEPRALLIDLLRDDLALTGTKPSCDVQVCGACTVLVDDLPVSSCTFLAVDAEGRHVRTIEGLATGNDLHPVQKAFVECSAMQCGYCTPGFVMAVVALLLERDEPTDQEIVHALEGNLCRCTGYRPIVAAVHRAVTLWPPSERS